MFNFDKKCRHGGFTLIEAAIATAVVGIGIVALLDGMASGTRINSAGRDITQAVFIAQEIREWTMRLPFSDLDEADMDNPPGPDSPTSPQYVVDDLDDLMDATFDPPRDGQGNRITEMADWTQTIAMHWKDPYSLTTTVPAGSSDVVSVAVTVCKAGREIMTTTWLVTRKQ